MNDGQIREFCRKNGIQLPMSWRHSCNAVRFHNSGESFNHWNFKSVIAHELMSRGYTIFTELKLPNRHNQPTCDLFWLEEKIVIEFESEWSEAKAQRKQDQYYLFNTFVFDIKKVSLDDVKKKIGLV